MILAIKHYFQTTWNAQDIEAVRAALHYPHVSLFPGRAEVRAAPAEFEPPFGRLRGTQGWRRSTLDRAHAIWSCEDKVWIDAHWSRYGEDGARYLSGNIVYLVTRLDGRWGIQCRARREPRDRDGPAGAG